MINLAVISIKDIIKFFKSLSIVFIIIIIVFKIFGNIKNGNYTKIENLKNKTFFDYSKIIDDTFIFSKFYNNEKTVNTSGIKKILASELSILFTEEELMEKENQEEVLEFENLETETIKENNEEILKEENSQNRDKENDEDSKEESTDNNITSEKNDNDASVFANIPANLPTKIIELNNKNDTYTDIYKNVKIKNESKYQLTEEILKPDFIPENIKDIIIYHTHTCESYTPTEKDNYMATGNFRTTDLNYSVARVGTELEKYLIDTFNVTHDVTYHDYPAYSGSYTRALTTIKKIVPENYSRFNYRLT